MTVKIDRAKVNIIDHYIQNMISFFLHCETYVGVPTFIVAESRIVLSGIYRSCYSHNDTAVALF